MDNHAFANSTNDLSSPAQGQSTNEVSIEMVNIGPRFENVRRRSTFGEFDEVKLDGTEMHIPPSYDELSVTTDASSSTGQENNLDLAVVWENLSVYKKTARKVKIRNLLLYERHEKPILRNVNGCIKFGELTAIMGK